MINNSFLYQYTEGGLIGLRTVKTATLIYFSLLTEWGGGFLYEVPYIPALLTFSQTEYR